MELRQGLRFTEAVVVHRADMLPGDAAVDGDAEVDGGSRCM